MVKTCDRVTQDKMRRESLPIANIPRVSLTTQHAKDTDTRYPPVVTLRLAMDRK